MGDELAEAADLALEQCDGGRDVVDEAEHGVDRDLLADRVRHVDGHGLAAREADDLHQPAGADHVHPLLRRLDGAGAVEHDVDPLAPHRGHGVGVRGVQDQLGTHLLRHLQPRVHQVGRQDDRRPRRLARHRHHQADRPRAQDGHPVAQGHPRALDGVDAAGQRLDQGSVLGREAIGQRIHEVRRRDEQLRERAVDGRGAGERHVGAQVVPPRPAHPAGPAGHARLHGHELADLEALDPLAQLCDRAGKLVAEHQRALDDHIADPPVQVVVDIGAAHPAVLHGHGHLARPRGRRGALLEGQLAGLHQHGGSHGLAHHLAPFGCGRRRDSSRGAGQCQRSLFLAKAAGTGL